MTISPCQKKSFFAKTKIKDAAKSSFHNAYVPQSLSEEELEALDRLSKNKNFVVQKADKSNSMVLVDRGVYVKHMENILKDNTKCEKFDVKTRTLNFQVNHQKPINEILKSLKSTGSLSDKQYKKIKAVGSRPGVLYGLCKVDKAIVDVCLDQYCLQLEHPLIKLRSFEYLYLVA